MAAAAKNLARISRTVLARQQREGGGFLVRRALGGHQLAECDPFLMLDHMGPSVYGPGEAVGAPDHPHRGFETVTYMLQGEFQHRDSRGNTGNLGPGWVQWMTAGSGVVHSEMPSDRIIRDGGTIEGFQLWVNLPAKDKMIAPRYQDVPPARIPEAKSADGRTTVKVISGTVGGVAAVIDTHSPITFLDVRVQPGAAPFDIAIPHGQSGFVYVFGGDAAGARFGSDDIVKLHHVGVLPASETARGDATLRVSAASAQSATQLLVVVGKPLNEPIARYGPFVMNTDEQLMQAFADYRAGRLGAIDGAEERYRLTREANRKRTGHDEI